MRLLALDQSLNETGYWITSDKDMHGVIKSKLKGVTERIVNIREKIKNMISLYSIDTIVMEDYSYMSSGRFTFTAGEVGGAIKLLCFDNKIKLMIVPPSLLKKFICNKGQAKKEQMLLQLYKKYGKEFNNNNIADAFGLFKFYETYQKWLIQGEMEDGFTKNDVECFKKLHSLTTKE